MVVASSGSRDNEHMIWNAQPYDPCQDHAKSRVCLQHNPATDAKALRRGVVSGSHLNLRQLYFGG